jgi:hypothetical protein
MTKRNVSKTERIGLDKRIYVNDVKLIGADFAFILCSSKLTPPKFCVLVNDEFRLTH